MRKPYSLKAYAEAVLAVSEGSQQGNFEETSSFLGRKLNPQKVSSVSSKETRQAIAIVTREAVLLGIDPRAALAEFELDLADLAEGILTRRAFRFSLRTAALMRGDHFVGNP